MCIRDSAGTAATADTNAYTFTPAAAGSEKAISVTASSTENFKLDSLVPAVANIYTLGDITGINNLTGDVYTWNSRCV